MKSAFDDLVEAYFSNRKIIFQLRAKPALDPGEETLLELFQELQNDVIKTIERYCERFGIKNPVCRTSSD